MLKNRYALPYGLFSCPLKKSISLFLRGHSLLNDRFNQHIYLDTSWRFHAMYFKSIPMIGTIYDELMPLVDYGGDMCARLKKMSWYPLFEPLATEYRNPKRFNTALFYILMLYTHKSPHWSLSSDWGQTKTAILTTLGLDPRDDGELYLDLTGLRIYAIYETVRRYLDYQGSRDWQHLSMMYDLYDELVSSARSPLKNKDGSIDYAQKRTNAQEAAALLGEIEAMETRLDIEERDMRDAKTEVKQRSGSVERFTMRLENIVAEIKAVDEKRVAAQQE